MYRDRRRNFDYDPNGGPASGTLHADHSRISRAEAIRRGIPVPPPDRLLHGQCNAERGDGNHDHKAPALDTTTQHLAMAWP